LVNVESDEEKILPILFTSVKDESGRIRRLAAQALSKYGERARPAVPALVVMLANDDDVSDALAALKIIGVRTIPELLKALNAKDTKAQVFACESLAALGPEARDALPRLRELAGGQSSPVQKAARAAIAKVEPPATPPPPPKIEVEMTPAS
jgi:HEAT repeat protein